MIGFHLQKRPRNWPDAVAKLPPNAMNKLVFGAQDARESRAVNPAVATWYRHVADQPLPYDNFEQHCRDWLNQFVDATFRSSDVAPYIVYVQEYNETLANSQDAAEKARWIELHSTMARLWHDEYRKEPELAHIKMILCETAIGNDIPWQIAEAAQRYDAALGYHPYVPCRVGNINVFDGVFDEFAMVSIASKAAMMPARYDAPRASFRGDTSRYEMQESPDDETGMSLLDASQEAINRPAYVSPHDWRWYSGRWATMDADFVARGIHVNWAFGEGGPVLDASTDWSGWLDPLGGWRNKDCLNGDFNKYIEVMRYWLDNAVLTPAYQEGRLLGVQLFTSGAPGGSGGQWANFDFVQPEMDAIADFAAAYDYPPWNVPPIPPDPPPTDCEGLPRVQYNRRALVVPTDATLEEWLSVCEVAYNEKQTVTGSYDDAGIGALDSKTAILYDIPNRQEFIDWYAAHYPCTVVEFRSYPNQAHTIDDIVTDLPTHPTKTYETRDTDDIGTIIIHHTTGDAFGSTQNIATGHINRGFPGIGYHYLIDGAGVIEQVNYHETISWHAAFHNDDSIGISLKGSFMGDSMPSDDQLDAAAWLVDRLQEMYYITDVIGHKETDYAQTADGATACPGDTWPEWKDRIV